MATAKVAMSLDKRLLDEVDRWVAAGDFANRSQALRAGLEGLRERRARRRRLLRELARLDPREERELAERRYRADVAWPEY